MKHSRLATLLIAFILLAGCSSGLSQEDVDQAVADALATEEQEVEEEEPEEEEEVTYGVEPGPSLEDEAEEQPAPAPEPEPVDELPNDELIYLMDLYDSLDNATNIMIVVSEAYEMWPAISAEEVIALTEEGRTSLATHIDHFNDVDPPARFEETHDLTLESWTLMDEAWAIAIEGLETMDTGKLAESTGIILRANDKLEEASDQLNEDLDL